jgi:hypothetical protein
MDEKIYATSDPKTGWTDKSKRTGIQNVLKTSLILLRFISSQIRNDDRYGRVGNSFSSYSLTSTTFHLSLLTSNQVQECQVIDIRTVEKDGYTALQLGTQHPPSPSHLIR